MSDRTDMNGEPTCLEMVLKRDGTGRQPCGEVLDADIHEAYDLDHFDHYFYGGEV